MHESGSSHTLLSTGLLERQVLQLHDDLALTVDDIAIIQSEEPQFLISQDTLSHRGNKYIRCTGMRADVGGNATM